MRRCTKCVMPDTKPGVVLDGEGVYQACHAYERRKGIEKKFDVETVHGLDDRSAQNLDVALITIPTSTHISVTLKAVEEMYYSQANTEGDVRIEMLERCLK